MNSAGITAHVERVRNTAAHRLSEPGVRLALTFGVMLIVTAAVAAYLLVCVVYFAVAPDFMMSDDADTGLFNAIIFIAVFAVIIPLCGGYRVVAASVCRGGKPELALMFMPFSSFRRFVNACFSTVVPVIRLLLPFVVPVVLIVVAATPDLIPEAGRVIYYCIAVGLILVCIPLSVMYFRATRGWIIAPHLLADNPDMRLRDAAAAGRACTERTDMRATRKLEFSYTGLGLLSVITLFIIAVFHTLPLISLAAEYNASIIYELYQNERSVK